MALRHLANAVPQFEEEIRRRKERPGEPVGYPTGYKVFDALGGATPGYFGFIAGIGGSGRSALGACIAMKMAKQAMHWNAEHPDEKPRVVVVWPLEDDEQEFLERHALRILPDESHITAEAYKEGTLRPEQYDELLEVADRLRHYPVLIEDSPNTSIRDIHDELSVVTKEYDVRFVMVDYIQRFKEAQAGGGNRYEVCSDIAASLHDAAREFHVPIWAMAQMKSSGKSGGGDKRRPGDLPIVTDVYGGDLLANKARFAFLLHRDDQHLATEIPGYVPNGEAKLIIAKNRGALGIKHMRYDAKRVAFLDAK